MLIREVNYKLHSSLVPHQMRLANPFFQAATCFDASLAKAIVEDWVHFLVCFLNQVYNYSKCKFTLYSKHVYFDLSYSGSFDN